MENEKIILVLIIGLIVWQVTVLNKGTAEDANPLVAVRLYDAEGNMLATKESLAVVEGVSNVEYFSLLVTVENVGNFELFDVGVSDVSPYVASEAFEQKSKYNLNKGEYAMVESDLMNVNPFINTTTVFTVNVTADYIDLDSNTRTVWKTATFSLRVEPDMLDVEVIGGSNSSIGPYEDGVACVEDSDCYSGFCEEHMQFHPYLLSNHTSDSCSMSCPGGYDFCVKRFGGISECVAGGEVGSTTGSNVVNYCIVEAFAHDSYEEVSLFEENHGYYSWGPCPLEYDFCLVYDDGDESICVGQGGYLNSGESYPGGWISGVNGYKYPKASVCSDGTTCGKAGDPCNIDSDCCLNRCYSKYDGGVLYHRCA